VTAMRGESVPHIDLPEDVPGIRSAMMFRPETAEPLLHLAEAPPRAQPRRARTDRRRSGLRRCPNRRQMRESTGGSAFRLLGESDLVNGGTRSAQATPRIGSQAIGQDRRMKVHRRAACRRAAPDDSEAPHLPLPGRPQHRRRLTIRGAAHSRAAAAERYRRHRPRLRRLARPAHRHLREVGHFIRIEQPIAHSTSSNAQPCGFRGRKNGHIPGMPVLRRLDRNAADRRTRRVTRSKRRGSQRIVGRDTRKTHSEASSWAAYVARNHGLM